MVRRFEEKVVGEEKERWFWGKDREVVGDAYGSIRRGTRGSLDSGTPSWLKRAKLATLWTLRTVDTGHTGLVFRGLPLLSSLHYS